MTRKISLRVGWKGNDKRTTYYLTADSNPQQPELPTLKAHSMRQSSVISIWKIICSTRLTRITLSVRSLGLNRSMEAISRLESVRVVPFLLMLDAARALATSFMYCEGPSLDATTG